MGRYTAGPWFRESKNTWYVWHEGRQINLKVRERKNKKLALEAWRALMVDGSMREPTKAQAVTVAEIVTGFLDDVRGRAKPKTVEVYKYFFTLFTTAHGKASATTVTPCVVEKFSRRPTWSSSSRYGFIGAMVAAFRWAERAGLIPLNPIRGIRKPPKASRGSKVVLTQEEFERLVEKSSRAFGVFLRGLWLTGCRPGELAGVTAADFIEAAGVAILGKHKTADTTGKPRVVYLGPVALTLFRDQAKRYPSGLLFPNSHGTAWNEDSVVTAMKVAKRKAKLPNAVAYGMRHSFATAALSNGVPDAQVAALLGHVGTGMLHRHYSHLTAQAQALRAAAGRVRG